MHYEEEVEEWMPLWVCLAVAVVAGDDAWAKD